jgi:hypothetical protein
MSAQQRRRSDTADVDRERAKPNPVEKVPAKVKDVLGS